MSLNALGLGIVMEAKDQFTETMERARHKFHEVEKSSDQFLGRFDKGMAHTNARIAEGGEAAGSFLSRMSPVTKAVAGVAAVGVAIAGAVGGAFMLGNEAAEGSLLIAQAGARAGATAEELEQLREAADKVGLQGLGTTADQAAENLKVLASNSLGVEGSIAALDASVRLAKVSMGELAGPQAAQGLASILAEFHLEADQSNSVVDKMAVGMRLFGVSATDVIPMVTGVARGAELAGASFEDALSAVGMAKRVLPDVGQAVMGVNMAMIGLASGASRAKLEAFGIHAKDASGGMRPLLSVLADLDTKMSGLTDAKKAEKLGAIFGPRGAGTMVAIMNELGRGVRGASGEMLKGSAAAEELNRQMANSQGAAKAMTKGLEGEMKTQTSRMRANLSMMMDLIGGPFSEMFTPALSLANQQIVKLNNSISAGEGAWGSMATNVRKIGLFFGGLGQLFDQSGFSGKILEDLNKAENQGIKRFAIDVWYWIGVIGEWWDGFVEGWSSTIEKLSPVFGSVTFFLGELMQALGIEDATAQSSLETWTGAKKSGGELATTLAGVAGVLAGALSTGLVLATGAINIFKAAWELVDPLVTPIINSISDAIQFVEGLLTGNWTKAWRSAAAVVMDTVELMASPVVAFAKLAGAVVDYFGKIARKDLGVERAVNGAIGQYRKFREEVARGPGPVVQQVAAASPLPSASSNYSDWASVAPSSAIVPSTVMSTTAQMMSTSAQGAALRAMDADNLRSVASQGAELHSTINLIVDGEKIAEANDRAKLRKIQRGFYGAPLGQE